MAAASATALLFLASCAILVACTLTAQRNRSNLTLHKVEGKSEAMLCERCPVGHCDRGLKPGGGCVWFVPPEDPTGAYHCMVDSCADVPLGSDLSGCWKYRSHSYYSVANKDAPCQDVASAPAARTRVEQTRTTTGTTTLTVTMTLTTTTATSTSTTKVPTSMGMAHGQAIAAKGAAHGNQDAQNAERPHSGEAAGTASRLHSAPEEGKRRSNSQRQAVSVRSMFTSEAASIAAEVKVRDPRLTAYWDQGTCGPMGWRGDDNNNRWCGGLVYKPHCEDIVHVNMSVCSSGKAKLAFVSGTGSGGSAAITLSGCSFMYFAQYECIASTTTTTTLTTTTETSTTTITSSTTRTSTTSTTTTFTLTSTTTTTSTHTLTTTTTSTTTPEKGSCPQPLLGQDRDVTDCAGVFPPNGTCTVRCARGYAGDTAVYACEDAELGFVGEGPQCASTTTTTSTSTTTVTTTARTTTAELEWWMMRNMSRREHRLTRNGKWSKDAGFPANCSSHFKLPDPPLLAPDFNGIHVPDVCFKSKGPHRVYVIGDWGGIVTPHGPKPADQRPKDLFVKGVDDFAQQRVAAQMAVRAKHRAPDYILNVGDCFYWAGLDTKCGLVPAFQITPTGQFEWNFEKIYVGEGIEGKPWLGVLGNHDYGGYMFNKGWDQLISYSWGPGGRWVVPGQYWRTTVHYPGFRVDYFFVDTNVFNAHNPIADPDHNICSNKHIEKDAGCGKEGPKDVWDCPGWFQRLWKAQTPWLEEGLDKSEADWQIIVTHFPPTWHSDFWIPLARKYGIDLIVTGHMHKQELHHEEDGNFLKPTSWIVSGGGGGITSEGQPDPQGYDDQYGFFELTLSKEVIEIQGISHGGFQRSLGFLRPRPRHDPLGTSKADPQDSRSTQASSSEEASIMVLKK